MNWLRAEADAGRVPVLRAGRAYVCDPDAVEAALLERAQQGKGVTSGAEQHNQTTDRKGASCA